ncbi:MAG TPA: hypothetical protein VNN79_08645, partial [Actinomycetota bacterium]|nr:hypothetical protein [Actinomycetota bacterium]
MRTVDDIPSTDLLLRPILELLRSGPAPIERDPLVDELIDSLGGVRSVTSIGSVVMVSSDEQRTLRSVVSDRTVDALDCLIRGGAVQRTNGTFPAWTITDVGRDLSDDELQVWFDRFVTGDTVAPQAAPDPGPILLEGTERYRPPAAAWALLAALAVAALVPAIVGGRSTALIDDDFSNPGQLGGWTTDRNARARLAYVDGTFRIS